MTQAQRIMHRALTALLAGRTEEGVKLYLLAREHWSICYCGDAPTCRNGRLRAMLAP